MFSVCLFHKYSQDNSSDNHFNLIAVQLTVGFHLFIVEISRLNRTFDDIRLVYCSVRLLHFSKQLHSKI